MSQFLFALGSSVTIAASGETGQVIARSEHLSGENQYHVRYKRGDGCACEQWWGESALAPA